MKKPRIFISHAWKYHDQYDKLIHLLENRKYFDFFDHSVPEDRPLEFANSSELEQKLKNHLAGCHCVLVIAGVYATYHNWIQKEIELAVIMDKPIIGIRRFGQRKISSLVKENAHAIVNWNTESIIKAIRNFQ